MVLLAFREGTALRLARGMDDCAGADMWLTGRGFEDCRSREVRE